MTKKSHKHMSLLIFCIFAISLLYSPLQCHAEMRSKNKILTGTPPFDIVGDIITANQKAVALYTPPKQGYAPLITWLTDPDERIQPQLIMSAPVKAIYTCRNMGAQLEVAAGQVEYGVKYLHTPILLITLDSDNQAIRFFMEGYSELAPSIRRELDHLHIPMATSTEKEKGKDTKKEPFAERLIQKIEANIDYQVAQAVALYQDRIAIGRLAIIGSIADFTNVYKRGAGRLIIINVNGETDNTKLRGLQLMTTLPMESRKLSIGRERPKAAPAEAEREEIRKNDQDTDIPHL